jgi:hypothetical protein
VNLPPATPTLSVSGITGLGAILTGSPFSDPNQGNTHSASEWQVDQSGGDWSSLVVSSGVSVSNLTSFTVVGLLGSTGYQARVRYRDNTNAWSSWSGTQSFTTSGGGGGGGGAAPLFFSDWRNQLGNTNAALQDGGKWDFISADAGRNGAVIAAPPGFPTQKALRVLSDGTRGGWMAPTVNTLGQIPVGSSRNYRWYHAFYEPPSNDPGSHPIQDGGAVSQSNWYFDTRNNLSGGRWGITYHFGGNSYPNDRWALGPAYGQWTPLTKGAVYRIEVQIVRTGTNSFRFHAWIHDAAGNLLYDDDDFRNQDGSASLASNPTMTFQVVANTGILQIGHNGTTAATWPLHSSDQAGFAVVQGLQERQAIGAYGNVTGEVPR